jgi:site-specific DNA-cytosine methylase
VVATIAAKRPRIFMLENVAGIVEMDSGKVMAVIRAKLQELRTYNIYEQVRHSR